MNVDIAERRGQKSSKGIVCFGFVWYVFFDYCFVLFWGFFLFLPCVCFVLAVCLPAFWFRWFRTIGFWNYLWCVLPCPTDHQTCYTIVGLFIFFKRFWWPRNNPWIVLDCSLLLHHSSLILAVPALFYQDAWIALKSPAWSWVVKQTCGTGWCPIVS